MEVREMRNRRMLDGKAVGFMVFFCAVLGMQQTVIKAAASDMSPVLQIAIRSGAAALLIGLYLYIKEMPLLPGKGKLLPGFFAGLLFTLEYLFVAEGLRFTNASHMVIMLYTAPAFAALGLHFLIQEERLYPMQWIGILLAFSGVAIAIYDKKAAFFGTSSGSMLLGDFLGLLAGVSWAATTMIIRTKLSDTPATQTTFIQLLTCFCVLLPGAIVLNQCTFSMTTLVFTSLAFQILLVCVVGMLLWFWLLTVYQASQLGALSFLTPVFGIFFGVVFLGEPMKTKFIVGSIMVLTGIALVSGWQWLAQSLLHRDKTT